MKKNSTDKRRKILNAALELIAENGFHGSPTSLIAENAGVGTGTIYRYFENKNALIEAIYQETHQKLITVMFCEDSEDVPARERFIRILTNFTKYLIGTPSAHKFLEQYYNSPYGFDKKREKLSSYNDPFKELLSYARSQHIIKNLKDEVLFAIAFGPITFLLKDHLAGFVQLDDVTISEVVRACWDGVKR